MTVSQVPPDRLGQIHAGHRATIVHIARVHPDRADDAARFITATLLAAFTPPDDGHCA